MQLSKAIEEFQRHLEANGCSQHTIRSYRSDLESLHRFYSKNGKKVETIRPTALAEFLCSKHVLLGPTGIKRADGAVNRVRAVLRSFFSWLHTTGVLSTDPACAIRVRHPRRPLPPLLSHDDQNSLLDAISSSDDPLAFRDRVMVEILFGTGIRVSELVKLDVNDINLDQRVMEIGIKGGGREQRYLRRIGNHGPQDITLLTSSDRVSPLAE